MQFPGVEEQRILEELTLTELLDKLNDVAHSKKILIKYSAALDHQNHSILQTVKSKSYVLEAVEHKSQQYENFTKEACRVLRIKRTVIDNVRGGVPKLRNVIRSTQSTLGNGIQA